MTTYPAVFRHLAAYLFVSFADIRKSSWNRLSKWPLFRILTWRRIFPILTWQHTGCDYAQPGFITRYTNRLMYSYEKCPPVQTQVPSLPRHAFIFFVYSPFLPAHTNRVCTATIFFHLYIISTRNAAPGLVFFVHRTCYRTPANNVAAGALSRSVSHCTGSFLLQCIFRFQNGANFCIIML